MLHLRIRQLNEWGQCAVLNLIANYVPETDDELYDILNILEERIKHSSSAVVLSAARCFVDLTAGYKDLREPMFLRLKAPLLTLIATAPSEIAYVVLTHLQHLLSLFDDEEDEDVDREQSLVIRAMGSDYKLFFCAYSDPVYIKLVKLDVLSSVVSQVFSLNVRLSIDNCTNCLSSASNFEVPFHASDNRLQHIKRIVRIRRY